MRLLTSGKCLIAAANGGFHTIYNEQLLLMLKNTWYMQYWWNYFEGGIYPSTLGLNCLWMSWRLRTCSLSIIPVVTFFLYSWAKINVLLAWKTLLKYVKFPPSIHSLGISKTCQSCPPHTTTPSIALGLRSDSGPSGLIEIFSGYRKICSHPASTYFEFRVWISGLIVFRFQTIPIM